MQNKVEDVVGVGRGDVTRLALACEGTGGMSDGRTVPIGFRLVISGGEASAARDLSVFSLEGDE